jgi:transcriptional regulator with XRE-family HTH domain
MFLGYRLKFLRRCRGMSQTSLGNAIGVSKVAISGYENGSRIPSTETLMQMLNFFNVSADYLLGRDINTICEDDQKKVILSREDINIINILRNKRELYNKIAENPNDFFEYIVKK